MINSHLNPNNLLEAIICTCLLLWLSNRKFGFFEKSLFNISLRRDDRISFIPKNPVRRLSFEHVCFDGYVKDRYVKSLRCWCLWPVLVMLLKRCQEKPTRLTYSSIPCAFWRSGFFLDFVYNIWLWFFKNNENQRTSVPGFQKFQRTSKELAVLSFQLFWRTSGLRERTGKEPEV